MIRRPPTSPLLPYTTFFRSLDTAAIANDLKGASLFFRRPSPTQAETPTEGAPAPAQDGRPAIQQPHGQDRKSTRLNSSHANISYAVFCLKKKTGSPRGIPFA